MLKSVRRHGDDGIHVHNRGVDAFDATPVFNPEQDVPVSETRRRKPKFLKLLNKQTMQKIPPASG
jgi:hypothetical protein